MASPKRARGSALALAALLFAWPAVARPADAGRSVASVSAPILAPGIYGNAPLYGELDDSGSFRLNAPAGQVSTGNPIYDAFLHRSLGSTITVVGSSPRTITANNRVRLYGVTATVLVAGRSAVVPLTVRTISNPSGTWLRAHARVALDNYGIRSATGGPAGPLGVAISAYFPRR
ncbi:MAG: hypothetical protein JWM80_5406 [Cyanobacteria bacterium RYN_339]|nr:hypothetical protein [Cyanobacteria bacterium RYN_339]